MLSATDWDVLDGLQNVLEVRAHASYVLNISYINPRALTMSNKLCQLMQHLYCQGQSLLSNCSCQIGKTLETTSTI